ncbi:MAG TPA: hypothetical protein VNQ76_12050 [Planctomicrobium sp.]|nr:hypothetical protein [Planctomicrobium sp.]
MPQQSNNLELEEQFFTTPAVRWQYWIPAIRMTRAFRMAIDYRRMLLALIAVFLWGAGTVLMFPPDTMDSSRELIRNRIDPDPSRMPWEEGMIISSHAFNAQGLVNAPGNSFLYAFSNGAAILWPVRKMMQPASELLFPSGDLMTWFRACGATLWGLLICSLFGGAIARMAAVDFAGRGELSVRQGFRYSVRHCFSYLGAPLIPLAGLAFCWIPNLLAGWVARVPYVGDTLVGVLWILPVIFGALMALIVIGIAVGWPLMVGAISADASDAFDGLSRAYSYLFNQLWYLVVLVLIMLLTGSAALYLVNGLLSLTVDLTKASVATGDGGTLSGYFVLRGGQGMFSPNADASEMSQMAIWVWGIVIRSIPIAFIFSYFWTTTTLIYFLLRLRDDATPLTEVAGFSTSQETAGIPVVGIPAAQLREASSPNGTGPDASVSNS